MRQEDEGKPSGGYARVSLGLLGIPCAFFGVEEYRCHQNHTGAAKGEAQRKWWQSAPSWRPVTRLWQREEIDRNEFRDAFEQARQQARAVQGDNFDPREFESIDNKRRVLDGLIDRLVMQMSASRAGIAVSDEKAIGRAHV